MYAKLCLTACAKLVALPPSVSPKDGVPLYGLCNDATGKQLTSCYKLASTAATGTVVTTGGTYTMGKLRSDYSYDTVCFIQGGGVHSVLVPLF